MLLEVFFGLPCLRLIVLSGDIKAPSTVLFETLCSIFFGRKLTVEMISDAMQLLVTASKSPLFAFIFDFPTLLLVPFLVFIVVKVDTGFLFKTRYFLFKECISLSLPFKFFLGLPCLRLIVLSGLVGTLFPAGDIKTPSIASTASLENV